MRDKLLFYILVDGHDSMSHMTCHDCLVGLQMFDSGQKMCISSYQKGILIICLSEYLLKIKKDVLKGYKSKAFGTTLGFDTLINETVQCCFG